MPIKETGPHRELAHLLNILLSLVALAAVEDITEVEVVLVVF